VNRAAGLVTLARSGEPPDSRLAVRIPHPGVGPISLPQLSPAELERYDRQIGPGVLSLEGQRRLKGSTVLVTRVGGMGGPAALMLVMGGVGRVIIAHGDDMISPDLNRQVLGSEQVLGKPRAAHFAAYLRTMNHFVEVEAIDHEPDDVEATELARRCDIIVSCPPTFEERLRLNRAAVEAGIPFLDAAQWGMNGSLIVVRPHETACLECVYPEPPPFEEMFPVVGAISSAMGSLAALEAIKILSQTGKPQWGRMLMIDGFQGRVSQVELSRREDCSCCGAMPGGQS
jgi:molybdopterin/thiamine biosynthesis adenylyltransferase